MAGVAPRDKDSLKVEISGMTVSKNISILKIKVFFMRHIYHRVLNFQIETKKLGKT